MISHCLENQSLFLFYANEGVLAEPHIYLQNSIIILEALQIMHHSAKKFSTIFNQITLLSPSDHR